MDLQELVLLEQFLKTLPRELAIWLKKQNPTSAVKAAEMADDYDVARRGEVTTPPQSQSASASAGNASAQITLQKTTPTFKSTNMAFQPQRSRTNHKGELQCHWCKNWGHIAAVCPQRLQSGVRATSRPAFLSTSTEVETNCEDKFVRNGKVDGKPIKILLDTGSKMSIVRADLVNQTRWNVKDGMPIQCVHGDQLIYPTAEVLLEVDGWSKSLRVALVPQVPVDMIVGTSDYCPDGILPVAAHNNDATRSLMVTTRSQKQKRKQVEISQKESTAGISDSSLQLNEKSSCKSKKMNTKESSGEESCEKSSCKSKKINTKESSVKKVVKCSCEESYEESSFKGSCKESVNTNESSCKESNVESACNKENSGKESYEERASEAGNILSKDCSCKSSRNNQIVCDLHTSTGTKGGSRMDTCLDDTCMVDHEVLQATAEQLKTWQQQDESLREVRRMANSDETHTTNYGRATLFYKDGILYRKWVPRKLQNRDLKTCEQLVLPLRCRPLVMQVGHDAPMAGHLGVNKTRNRILSRYYWPGIFKDISSYCRSCEVCQRSQRRQASVRAEMISMPLISKPFQRIAMDVVGPLPRSQSGNRFILTICDYATRYPEAVPLPSVEAERVAKVLIFFHVLVYLTKFLQTKVPTLCLPFCRRSIHFCRLDGYGLPPTIHRRMGLLRDLMGH